MPWTETLMDDAPWDFQFDPATPTYILDRLDPRHDLGLGAAGFATIIVTRQRLDQLAITDAAVRNYAIYAGVIYDLGEDRLNPQGSGLVSFLGGDQDGGTFHTPGAAATPARTLLQHLTSTMLLGTDFANGLGIGTVDDTGADTWAMKQEPGVTRREMLDTIPGMPSSTAREWYVRPNGLIDVQLPANLFTTGGVLLTPTGGSAPGRKSFQADLSMQAVGVGGYTTFVVVNWDDSVNYGSQVTLTISSWRGLGGGVIKWWQYITWRPKGRIRGKRTKGKVAAYLLNNQVRANNVAFRAAVEGIGYLLSVDAEIDLPDPSQLGKCGDTLYVYDVRRRLVNRSNPIPFQARQGHPVGMRMMTRTCPFLPHFGVYARVWNTTTAAFELLDVSRWVVSEDTMTTVNLSSQRKFHNRKPRHRRSGLHWPRGVPWSRRLYGRRVRNLGA